MWLFRYLPSRISCLISSPTMKKKMAMRPSFTQPCGDSACPATNGPTGLDQNFTPPALVPAVLASVSEMAVATRSATLPKPFSCSSCSFSIHGGTFETHFDSLEISQWPSERSKRALSLFMSSSAAEEEAYLLEALAGGVADTAS